MERRTSALARIFAALALIVAIVAVIAVASGSFGEGDSAGTGQNQAQTRSSTDQPNQRSSSKPKAKTYTVKSGDTLSAIAEETGVSVEALQRLNPEVDALALTEGEELKLR